MRFLRPRSLSGLVLLGLLLIALPLLAALVVSAIQMRRLGESSERIVTEGVNGTRLTQQLFTQTALLERQVRLYSVLGDAKVLEAYRAQSERLAATERQMSLPLNSSKAKPLLQDFGSVRERVDLQMQSAAPGAVPLPELLSELNRMQQLTEQISAFNNAQIDTGIETLRARTQRTQRFMFWGAALLVPLTALAILLFSLRLARPLRQIDRAIDELGRGAFLNPITITGPVDLERLGKQLEWLRHRLLDLAQDRNRFLRHMSHELKTPLANIREGTELLMDGAVGELQTSQREVTSILRENGIRLQRMIENLLSFSAWQTSSVGLELSDFRLRPLIKQIIENQQLALLSQRIRLEVQVDDLQMTADRGKLRLIIENLLSNAIKYTPRNGTIAIKAQAGAGQLQLDVADTGPGIAVEERKQVFEAFYTGKAPGGHVKGTGIGLSVVMEFVMAHEGRIDFVDGEWPGAHFRVHMPLTRAAVAPPEQVAHKPLSRKQAHAA